MNTYWLYLIGIVAAALLCAVCLHAQLYVTALALAIIVLGTAVSIHGRLSRLRYAYRETERENERLHARLAEAERQLLYLRQLTENVDTALFVCDTEGRIDWMNQAASTLLTRVHPKPLPPPFPEREGASLRERGCVEKPSTEVTPPLQGGVGGGLLPSPERGWGAVPPSILQAIADHAEVVDGCALSTVLLRIDGQRRLVVALKDVSVLMQRQEMEAWQQLIRVLTHEIMNSLTPIISISETLTDENEAFAVINRRCHALLDFVESYRQLTRIKTPERTTFPVGELFEHIASLYPQVKLSSAFVLDGSPVEPLLSADRAQLEAVLINLVKNAYESGATEVTLTAQPLPFSPPQGEAGGGLGAGGGAVIRVRDNGTGMSPDVLAHAFTPFFTTKPSGTGIGLSLCRQIILKHGGTISVESEEGHGTTFTLTLP